jgi:hypothetical protein
VSAPQRLRRPDPERTEPLRHWSKLYRTPDSWNLRDGQDEAPSSAEAATESWNDVVAEGVAVGYRVIEEQIRHGQRVAEQLSDASYGPAMIAGDVREATERMIRYSADLVALWMEFVNSTMGSGELLRPLAAAWQQRGDGQRPASEPGATAAVAIDVCSSRPVRVSVDLKPGAARRPLVVHGLRAVQADKPVLTEVTFEPAREGEPATVRLRVPEGHPAGLYTGVIVDQQSGEPLGTLSARVSE